MFYKTKKYLSLFIFSLFTTLFIYYYVTVYAETEQLTEKIIFNSFLDDQWYKNDPKELSKSLDHYFELAQKHFASDFLEQKIAALILPHAGHAYSGICAASGYAALQNKTSIKSIIILAPSHHLDFQGIALPDFTHYQMPLGIIPINQTKKKVFEGIPYAQEHPNAFLKEHSIEIHLPFIQKVLPHAEILPLIVGNITAESLDILAQGIIDCLDEKTLIIVSSDFIHYGSSFEYTPFANQLKQNIVALDQQALKAISQASLNDFQNYINATRATICGRNPLALLLKVFEKQKSQKEAYLTSYYLSPQVPLFENNRISLYPSLFLNESDELYKQSVSYHSIIFTEETASNNLHIPTEFEKQILLSLARFAIEKTLKQEKTKELIIPIGISLCDKKHGAFVTLTNKNHQLRGCIGNIVTDRPLSETILNMARAAAFNDTRFSPVQENELDDLIIQISLLSKPERIDSLDQFKLGIDGIILNKKDATENLIASAVFLPEVAQENNWTKEETAKQLSIKAGLEPDAWKTDTYFEVFETIKISE